MSGGQEFPQTPRQRCRALLHLLPHVSFLAQNKCGPHATGTDSDGTREREREREVMCAKRYNFPSSGTLKLFGKVRLAAHEKVWICSERATQHMCGEPSRKPRKLGNLSLVTWHLLTLKGNPAGVESAEETGQGGMRHFELLVARELVQGAPYIPRLGPPVVPFYPFLGEGSPTKIDYREEKGLFEPLLEDLAVFLL